MTAGDIIRATAAFAAQLLVESGVAGVAMLVGMAATSVAANLLLNPAHHQDAGALTTGVYAVILFGPPVLAGVLVDRRVRFFGGRTLDARSGPWVAALGAFTLAAAQLAATAIENAPAPPDSAGGSAVIAYVAGVDSSNLALGLFVMWPAVGMMAYGVTKLILRYLYRNHPNQPPRTSTTKPPAVQTLHLGGQG